MPRKPSDSAYALHPAYNRVEAGRRNLIERTGKTLEQWADITRTSGPPDRKAKIEWLKTHHGMGSNYAEWIVMSAEGSDVHDPDAYDPDGLVAKQYAGPKAELRPIYERLLALAMSLGADVTATPCSTYVPVRRKFAFAQIKPTTRTRIDLLLALGPANVSKRVTETGGIAKGDRMTHQIAIGALQEVDGEVERWLRAAYAKGNDTRLVPDDRTVTRTDELPADFKRALGASAKAKATFATLTPRMKGEWVAWITEAKKADTRAKRVATAVEKLAAGHKRMYA
jgi:hypothetical protein